MKAPGEVANERHVSIPQLWQIAADGDADQLEMVLSSGADINALNPAGLTPLMVAAYRGRTEIVKSLIKHGADVNATDRDGLTAAMMADDADHAEIVRILVGHAVRRKQSTAASESVSIQSAEGELPEFSRTDSPEAKTPEIRTLHEPPDIWDMVHETPPSFNPGSAFFGRVAPRKLLMPAAIVLIVGGISVLGFKALQRWLGNNAVSTTRIKINETRMNVNSARPLTKTAKAASNQRPVRKSPAEEIAVSTILNPRNIRAGAAGLRSPQLVADSQRDQTTASVRDHLASDSPEERSTTRKSILRITNGPILAARGETARTQLSVKPVLRPDNQKQASPLTVKREAPKVLGPDVNGPPRATPSPRGKVIQWP
jgi:hypothetical protein